MRGARLPAEFRLIDCSSTLLVRLGFQHHSAIAAVEYDVRAARELVIGDPAPVVFLVEIRQRLQPLDRGDGLFCSMRVAGRPRRAEGVASAPTAKQNLNTATGNIFTEIP